MSSKYFNNQIRESQFSCLYAINRLVDTIRHGDNQKKLFENMTNLIRDTLGVDSVRIVFIDFKRPMANIIRNKLDKSLWLESHLDLPSDKWAKLFHGWFKVKSFLWYPLYKNMDGFYLLTLYQTSRRRTWSNDDLVFLHIVAKCLEIAIHTSNLLNKYKQTEEALREKSRILDLYFEHTHTALAVLDRNFNFIRVNKIYAQADNRDVSFFLGRNHFDLYPSNSKEIFEQVIKTKTAYHVSAMPFIYKDNPERGIFYWDWALVPVLDLGGEVDLLFLSLVDVTELKRVENSLREKEASLRQITDNMLDIIFKINAEGIIQYVNSVVQDILGFSPGEMIGKSLYSFISRDDSKLKISDRVKLNSVTKESYRYQHANGHYLWLDSVITPIIDETGRGFNYIIIARDITDHLLIEEQLQFLSTNDSLTGIYNRSFMEKALKRTVAKAKRGNKSALLVIDVDNFKLVNDTFAHAFGDRVLIFLVSLLKNYMREEDLLARLSGDEFALLLEGSSLEEAKQIAEKIRGDIDDQEFYLDKQIAINLTVSIGVVLIDGKLSYQKVLSLADIGLNTAKNTGRNKVVFVESDEGIITSYTEKNQIISLIKNALRENRFILFFQPIIRIADGSVNHYESLIRLKDNNGELMLPHTFIPVAEQFGLMPQIDRWVFRAALQFLQANPNIKLFMNISGQSLGDNDLLLDITKGILESGINPERIGFEITETAAVKDLVQAECWINQLKDVGCSFALDDFGSGFSSFSYLRFLPVDYLKIDGSFVRNLEKDQVLRSLVQAISSVANSLGKETIAGFVENESILEILADLGISYGQGYHLGKPVPYIA